jgi:hypothetical protein
LLSITTDCRNPLKMDQRSRQKGSIIVVLSYTGGSKTTVPRESVLARRRTVFGLLQREDDRHLCGCVFYEAREKSQITVYQYSSQKTKNIRINNLLPKPYRCVFKNPSTVSNKTKTAKFSSLEYFPNHNFEIGVERKGHPNCMKTPKESDKN